ncbi:MAG: YdcF family protein [Acidimicrobiales bacterium]
MRLIRRALAAVLGVTILFVTITTLQVWWTSRQQSTATAEAIVVLGAAQYDGQPSPVLQGRLDHAFDLWEDGRAPIIVVTGGGQEGDRFTEASSSAQYLHSRGVPDEAILREVQGTNTWESLAATALILDERDLNRVLLVTDPMHALRTMEIALSVGLEGDVSPNPEAAFSTKTQVRQLVRESVAVAVGRLVGHQRAARWIDRLR